jgi:hypothetical protein
MARTARQAASAAPAPAPAPAPAYGGYGGGYGGGWGAAQAARGPAPTVPGVLPAGHVRTPPNAPEHLPDPSTLPGLLHLSSLRLAVRIPKDATHTIAELRARLAPHGLCVKDSHGSVSADGTGPIGLRTLFRTNSGYHYSASRVRPCSAALPADALLRRRFRDFACCAAGASAAASAVREQRLGDQARQAARAAHHRALGWLGRAERGALRPSAAALAPATDVALCCLQYCVHLPRDSKKRDLLARAMELSGANAQTEQVVILQVETPTRIAGEPAQCPIMSWVAGARRESYHGTAYGDEDKLLDEKLPTGTRLRGSFPTFVAYRLPAGKFVAVHLRRQGVKKVTHKRARDVRMFGSESSLQTCIPNGLVALLPMPTAGQDGGVAAHGQLLASLKRFMTPLLKEEEEYVAPVALMHSTATGRYEEVLQLRWHGQRDITETSYSVVKEPAGPYGQVASADVKASLVRFVAADWSAATLDTAFDIAGMVTPRDCDASALADRAAELETLQHEWEEDRSAKRARQVADELSTNSEVTWNYHSGSYDPMTHTRSEGSWSRSTPLLCLKTALVQTDDERTGELTVDLYVAANPASAVAVGVQQHCASLFAVSADGPGERYTQYGGGTAAALKETMNTLLERDSPNHATNARMWRELEYRFGRDPSVLTINGLLAAVESQERSEALQPPGLSVQLRPYQRQALSFMIDAEKLEGAGHFWSECPLPAASGAAAGPATGRAAVWFSPMLNRLTREEPARCAGGMLCSEMVRSTLRATAIVELR